MKSIDPASGTAIFAYRRSKSVSGFALEIIGSSSLQGEVWNPATIRNETLQDFIDHEWVEAEVSVPSGDRYFLRLRARID